MAITIDGDGTITGVSVGGLPDGIVDADMLASSAVTTAKINAGAVTAAKRGAGAVLQVVHAAKADLFSVTGSQGNFSTVFSAQITPSASSNKVLVMWTCNLSCSSANFMMGIRILRDSTAVGIGDALDSRTRSGASNLLCSNTIANVQGAQSFLDSPSTTSQVTYNLQVGGEGDTGTLFVNRNGHGGTTADHYMGASHLVLMEVAA
tara:strand:+ start:1838 stop:2455 length:618 start_codon:yes stop_codon:yes gene_type:complete